MDPGGHIIVSFPGEPDRSQSLADARLCTIGRSHSCDLILDDPAVSRRHARLFREGGEWWIEDLGSRNGTFVEDRRLATPRALKGGERIQIGPARLRLRPGGQPSFDHYSDPGLTVALRSVSVNGILGTGPGAAPAPAPTRGADLLHRVDRFARELLACHASAALDERVTALAADLLAADRAAVFHATAGSEELVLQAVQSREPDAGAILVSRSIARQALSEHEAVLVRDATADARFSAQESVVMERIRTAVCVPLYDGYEVTGLLYADRRSLAAPFTDEDLSLAALFAHLAAVKMRETRAQEELARRRLMEEELKSAARIQRGLLPSEGIDRPEIQIFGRTEPCLDVGGDYFDLLERPGGGLLLAVGDVCGKGMSAALIMASLHAQVRALAETGAPLAELARRLNAAVHRSVQGSHRFITLFLAELDPAAGRLRFVNAGHNPPLLLRAGGEAETLTSGGLILGVVPDIEYEVGEAVLDSGDLLLVISDGVTEAEAAGEEQFGDARLLEWLRPRRGEPPAVLVEALIDAVHAHTHPAKPGDDITVMAIRRP
ncbi:MAG: SpoIIE family protein phosphatase [Candidatus Krumholzibacteriota bacterium]|nr:SpoIIE family protein phosphatase [Candidatus Krumholzibacteriota bacterium]